MPFYDSIADYYDFIFPLNTETIDFVGRSLSKPCQGKRILDVGCGTGDLAFALADLGYAITAIDSDAAMIEKASEKAKTKKPVVFEKADMRYLTTTFGPASFDLVLCLGNTLVHLTDPGEVETFLLQARQVLNGDGRLVIQILNYDHVLDHSIQKLPLIENAVIRFERWYTFEEAQRRFTFNTTLTVKETNMEIHNAIPLYPLRKHELDLLLRKAGFAELVYYGDFTRGPLKADSLPLIVEAFVTSYLPEI